MNKSPTEPWHLDKRVPAALIITILVQSAAAVWFAATLNGRVFVLERDVERNRVVNARHEAEIRTMERGAARLEQKLESILDAVERMDKRLERLVQQ